MTSKHLRLKPFLVPRPTLHELGVLVVKRWELGATLAKNFLPNLRKALVLH